LIEAKRRMKVNDGQYFVKYIDPVSQDQKIGLYRYDSQVKVNGDLQKLL
jgi:hypothetical protein